MRSSESYERLENLAHDLLAAAENCAAAARREEQGQEPGWSDHLQEGILSMRIMAVARWEMQP